MSVRRIVVSDLADETYRARIVLALGWRRPRDRRPPQRRHRPGRPRGGADLRHGRRPRPGRRHPRGGRGGAAQRLPRVRQLAGPTDTSASGRAGPRASGPARSSSRRGLDRRACSRGRGPDDDRSAAGRLARRRPGRRSGTDPSRAAGRASPAAQGQPRGSPRAAGAATRSRARRGPRRAGRRPRRGRRSAGSAGTPTSTMRPPRWLELDEQLRRQERAARLERGCPRGPERRKSLQAQSTSRTRRPKKQAQAGPVDARVGEPDGRVGALDAVADHDVAGRVRRHRPAARRSSSRPRSATRNWRSPSVKQTSG